MLRNESHNLPSFFELVQIFSNIFFHLEVDGPFMPILMDAYSDGSSSHD